MNKYLGKIICAIRGKHEERKLFKRERDTFPPELDANRNRVCRRCGNVRIAKAKPQRSHRNPKP